MRARDHLRLRTSLEEVGLLGRGWQALWVAPQACFHLCFHMGREMSKPFGTLTAMEPLCLLHWGDCPPFQP